MPSSSLDIKNVYVALWRYENTIDTHEHLNREKNTRFRKVYTLFEFAFRSSGPLPFACRKKTLLPVPLLQMPVSRRNGILVGDYRRHAWTTAVNGVYPKTMSKSSRLERFTFVGYVPFRSRTFVFRFRQQRQNKCLIEFGERENSSGTGETYEPVVGTENRVRAIFRIGFFRLSALSAPR